MRRVISIVFFVLGGWMLMGEIFAASLDVEPGLHDNLFMILFLGVLVVALLLIGTWISPGERRRELGLTILIAIGISLFACLSFAMVMIDPRLKAAMPPQPDMHYAPLIGTANLLVITALGWWLYRRKPDA